MSRAKPLALIAILFAVTVELLRACGPLIDSLAGQIGIVPAAVAAVALFCLPGALTGVLRRVGAPVVIGLLLLVRILAQFVTALPVIGAGAVLGLVCLAVTIQRAGRAGVAVAGLLAGGALDLAIRSLTTTWDLIWIDQWGLLMAGLVAVALWLSLGEPTPDPADPVLGRIWVLGAYLALWTTTIGNPAFAASQSAVPLQLALLAMLASLALAAELIRLPIPGWVALPALLTGLGLAWWATAPAIVLTGLTLTQLAAALALHSAWQSPGSASSRRGTWAYGLVWVMPVLLYQVHYDLPLPFDNRLLIVGVGALLGLAALSLRVVRPVPLPRLSLALAAVLLVPGSFLVTEPSVDSAVAGTQMKLLTWNIKYGRDDARGVAEPRQIAAAIRSVNPDIVVLQEVSRGWAIGGGVDVAEYLARDLGMAFYWGGAADEQFGNVLLTRLPVSDVRTGALPFGQGPMDRSYLSANIGGISLLTTHLTHRKQNTPTRLDQISTILARKPDVVAGDLNFWPTWSEPLAFTRAGYFSAQDLIGYPPEWTSPSSPATNRVDWIFGSARVVFSDFKVLSDITVSDHIPLLTTVSLR
jgi:endonuclease/exonuclease/phosphatase family metal-dependent hydrolase